LNVELKLYCVFNNYVIGFNAIFEHNMIVK